MKKLIALLLALMMALVCVSALATGDGLGEDNGVPTENTGDGNGEGGNGEGGSGEIGSGEGGTTSGTPAATTAATAADPSVDTGYNATTAPTTGLDASKENKVTVTKRINPAGTGAKVPAQDVTFTVGSGSVSGSSATAPVVTFGTAEFKTEGEANTKVTAEVEITLPTYSTVGVYTYPVTEDDTDVAGMKKATELELKVTVINGIIKTQGEEDKEGLVIAGIALRQKDVKTDTIENDYEAHVLTVGKTVSGNLGDKTKFFPITVVLNAPQGDKVYGSVGVAITGTGATVKEGDNAITNTIDAEANGWETKTLALSLKDGQSVKFDNLPAGITYTVVEDPTIDHIKGTPTDAQLKDPDAYVVSDEVTTATALSEDTDVTISNVKNIDVDTGVTLDSAVYMLIMALALAGFVALKIRRREDY